ncbi:hypothetical protein EKQ61_06620 [Staphylococcus gallinarum]|nr:hypothetical protein EKQ61_06620 [Staphylococcus gallinarum]
MNKKDFGTKILEKSTQMNELNLSECFFIYYILLARFPRGQLQPVVFSLSCSHRSLANIRRFNKKFTLKYT